MNEVERVERAEQTLASLEDKRKALVIKATELDAERKQIAFAAHSGSEPKARARLDKINLEHATFASEMNSLTEAIAEANTRLNAAQAVEALAADRAKAQQIAGLKTAFVENGINAGDALSDFIGSILEMKQQRDDMEALGIKAPTSRQFQVNAIIAIKTILQTLPSPWVNELQDWRLLLHPQRQSFKDITADWDAMITGQIAARFGTKHEEAA
jgi:hypothetical protein